MLVRSCYYDVIDTRTEWKRVNDLAEVLMIGEEVAISYELEIIVETQHEAMKFSFQSLMGKARATLLVAQIIAQIALSVHTEQRQ